jgi:PAS domain S-box-containing protein
VDDDDRRPADPERLTPIRLPTAEVLAVLFERAPEIITITDRRGQQLMVNEAGLRLLGFDKSFRTPEDGFAFVHPDDRELLLAHRQLLAERSGGGEPSAPVPAIRYRIKAGTGEWRWLEMVTADMSDVPEVGGRVAFSRDVTDAEERAQALLESRARLAALVASFRDGAFVDDAHGTVLLANQGVSDLCDADLPPGHIIGRPTSEVLATLELCLQGSTRLADAGDTLDGARDVEVTTRSGRDLVVEVVTIRDGDDRYGRLWLFHDATARREADRRNRALLELEQQARRAAELHAEQLAAYDQLRNDFVARVSHELRTPLTAIASAAELLLSDEDVLGPTVRDRLAIIQRNSDRLREMVEDLLLVGRLDAGMLSLETRAVDLRTVTEEVVARLEPMAEARDVAIRCTFDEPLTVRADPRRLTEIIGNLLDNAVKFTVTGSEVVVTAERSGRGVELSVHDSGPGIPLEARATVFDRFARTPQADRSATPGAGLGLSIVKGLVELHGGMVTIGDAPDGGAVVTVTLPAESPESTS